MARRVGISNVVATIILIAVAIALAVAVAIWAFGLFKSTHAGTLQILDYRLYVNPSAGNLLGLQVENPTGTVFTVVSVSVGGQSCTYDGASTSPPTSVSSTAPGANGVVSGTNNAVSVYPGASAWLYYYCGSPGSLQAGVQYDGTVVLSTGAVLRFTVVAQPG